MTKTILMAIAALAIGCAYQPPRSGDPMLDAGTDSGELVAITMEQAPSPGVVQAIGCTVNSGQTISESTWYRVFPLADYGVTNQLTLTQVSFWAWKTQGTRIATLTIGSYTGAFQSPSFQASRFTDLRPPSDFTAPDTAPTGQLATVDLVPPLVIDAVAHPQIAIRLSTSELLLGANDGTQTAHGYFGSSTCGLPLQDTGSFFILTAAGTSP